MPLDSSLVGQPIGSITAICDARWLMAFSSGVPDERPELYDTTSALVTHPLFPVAPEWELLITHQSTPESVTPAELRRGVHATHDVILERSLVAGETIHVTATVAAVDRRPAGAVQQLVFEATDTGGHTVWRTRFSSLFRGVELRGEPAFADIEWPRTPSRESSSDTPVASRRSWVRPIDAHVYTECARIWNPIHTDVAIARSAGLDNPILHGTATLARAVSIVTELASIPVAEVERVVGSFSAMVQLGSFIDVQIVEITGHAVHFVVLNDAGERAVRNGVVVPRH